MSFIPQELLICEFFRTVCIIGLLAHQVVEAGWPACPKNLPISASWHLAFLHRLWEWNESSNLQNNTLPTEPCPLERDSLCRVEFLVNLNLLFHFYSGWTLFRVTQACILLIVNTPEINIGSCLPRGTYSLSVRRRMTSCCLEHLGPLLSCQLLPRRWNRWKHEGGRNTKWQMQLCPQNVPLSSLKTSNQTSCLWNSLSEPHPHISIIWWTKHLKIF